MVIQSEPWGILAPIFAQARRIAHQVAGMRCRAIEGRSKQAHQMVARVHQKMLGGLHSLPRADRFGQPRDHRPRLRQRVDARFLIGVRAERRTVVEEGPQIPVAVPGGSLGRRSQLRGALPPRVTKVGMALHHVGERIQRGRQEPREPNTFAAPFRPDVIHSIIPIAGADQRQVVRTPLPRPVQSPMAMLPDRSRVRRCGRNRHPLHLTGRERRRFQE